ncbi:helix-turn-helix transcriptional regulator [Terrabacter sp. MAHUQ-38]|uniref:helix-turn-helix domain-containing protein n=1 Tax=unclassified Terrabacter TaxID=2630222 RepID=UPI00165E22B6|nr:helix-turn-helix transcriptional regulator [Terrabacter sp. MAHUQ-38]
MATDKRAAEYLGKAVSVARIERGMKRTELEEKTQLSYAYLSEIEKGRKYPSQAALSKLADALDLTAFELLSRAEMLERGITIAQDPFAVLDGTLGFAVDAPQPMLTSPGEDVHGTSAPPARERGPGSWSSSARSTEADDVVERVSTQVYETVAPRMREWLMREIQLAVREELLRWRETR